MVGRKGDPLWVGRVTYDGSLVCTMMGRTSIG